MIESSSIKVSGSGTSDGAIAVSDIPSKQTSQTQTQTLSKKDEIEYQSKSSNITIIPIANPKVASIKFASPRYPKTNIIKE